LLQKDKKLNYDVCWLYHLTQHQQHQQQQHGMYPRPVPHKLVRKHKGTIQFIAEFSPLDRSCIKLTFLTHIQQPQALTRFYAGWIRRLQRARTRILVKHMTNATPLMLRDLAGIVSSYACELHSQYAIAPSYLETVERLDCV